MDWDGGIGLGGVEAEELGGSRRSFAAGHLEERPVVGFRVWLRVLEETGGVLDVDAGALGSTSENSEAEVVASESDAGDATVVSGGSADDSWVPASGAT